MFSHLLIACMSIIAATVLCYIFGYRHTQNNTINELKRQVIAVAKSESMAITAGQTSRGSVVDIYQSLTNSSVFFVDVDGENVRMRRYVTAQSAGQMTLTDSQAQASVQNEYSLVEVLDSIDRHFINRVLNGETVTAMQRFKFADGVIVFAGAPISDGENRIVGGVILAQPVAIVRAISRNLTTLLFVAAGISILLAIVLALAQTRMLVLPIQKMTRAAHRMADGDYAQRIVNPSNDEIGQLGRTLNTLSLRLMETIESLREERDRLELVIGSIEEGILAVDQQMHVVHCNMAFLELMEIDRIDALTTSSREDVVMLVETLRNVMQDGEHRKQQWKNLSQRTILAEVSPIADFENHIGAVCLLSDVSESERLEKLRRDYVANISHELRTPLTGIRGMIEPLLDGYVDTEEERMNCYSIIQKETIRLEKLVGEMLDMSRLQDGRIAVELEEMELPGILEAAVRNMQVHAQEAGVALTLETDGSELKCMGNEDRIMQVLIILLDNALGFTPTGGTVTVFAFDAGKRIVAGVRDTGCGIEPKDLPLIWERFYKVDRSRMRTKGTGLGLAIAKLIVELMGGEISVQSEVGKGSEFRFTLEKAAQK